MFGQSTYNDIPRILEEDLVRHAIIPVFFRVSPLRCAW